MQTWTPGITLFDLEKAVIERALKFYSNNKTETAKSLGIAVRTLDNKLKAYEEIRVEEIKADRSLAEKNADDARDKEDAYFEKIAATKISSFSMGIDPKFTTPNYKNEAMKINTRPLFGQKKATKGAKNGKKATRTPADKGV